MADSSAKRRSQSHEHGDPQDIEEVGSVAGNVIESVTLRWILAEGADFLVYKAAKLPDRFRFWVATVTLDPACPKVVSLSYLHEPAVVAADIVSWVLWAIVYVRMGGTFPFPDRVSQVSGFLIPFGVKFQCPEAVPFPRTPSFHEDIRFKAREKWELLCSWVQYWYEAHIHVAHECHFFGGARRMESRMMLFIIYHINEILPVDAPIRLDKVMANTGWEICRATMRKECPELLLKIAKKETKKLALESKDRAIIKMRERTKAELNVAELTELVHKASERYQAVQKKQEDAQKVERRRRQTQMARLVENQRRGNRKHQRMRLAIQTWQESHATHSGSNRHALSDPEMGRRQNQQQDDPGLPHSSPPGAPTGAVGGEAEPDEAGSDLNLDNKLDLLAPMRKHYIPAGSESTSSSEDEDFMVELQWQYEGTYTSRDECRASMIPGEPSCLHPVMSPDYQEHDDVILEGPTEEVLPSLEVHLLQENTVSSAEPSAESGQSNAEGGYESPPTPPDTEIPPGYSLKALLGNAPPPLVDRDMAAYLLAPVARPSPGTLLSPAIESSPTTGTPPATGASPASRPGSHIPDQAIFQPPSVTRANADAPATESSPMELV